MKNFVLLMDGEPVAAGGGVTPPAATNTPTPEPVSTPPAAAPDWTSGLNDDHKAYVTSKGFKDPTSVMDSYRNLEKLLSVPKERVLKLPEKADDPAWGEVYDRLGRPKDANGYDIKLDDLAGGENMAKWMKENFHALGISKASAEKFAAKYVDLAKTEAANLEAKSKAEAAQGVETLKQEWGQALEKNSEMVEKAASVLGLTDENLKALRDSMGGVQAMKFMHKIAESLGGEDKFLSGEKGTSRFDGVLSPKAAVSRIAELRQDQTFTRKYIDGDVDAKQEMERLHRYAYGS